jgi:hypothetical protein
MEISEKLRHWRSLLSDFVMQEWIHHVCPQDQLDIISKSRVLRVENDMPRDHSVHSSFSNP